MSLAGAKVLIVGASAGTSRALDAFAAEITATTQPGAR